MTIELNKIYNMDCIEWMKLIPDWSIDCIITDPPYWTTACKRDTIIPFELMREQLKRIIKPNWAIVLFWSEPFSSALRMSNIKWYKYDWKRNKNKKTWFANAKKQPMRCIEDIMIFYNKLPIYNPQWLKKIDKICKNWKSVWWNTLRTDIEESANKWSLRTEWKQYFQEFTWYPHQVLEIKSETNTMHPTQKPVALIEYLIKTYSLENDVILDFTSGSWTTWIAAQNNNRQFILIEKDKNYYDISLKRLQENQERLDKLSKKDII
jgi:site-specific DNA-methyltransferase (adenine-specific)